jgi:hypothetical protein
VAKWTEDAIRAHYRKAKRRGWIPYFVEASRATGERVEVLMAVASRESNMENIRGDFRNGRYNGYSLMQLDIGSHPVWIRSGAWQDVRSAVLKGAQALAEKRAQIRRNQGRHVQYGPRNRRRVFVGSVVGIDEDRTALAAYNSGLNAHYWHTKTGNPDRGTTGRDYGRDVLARAAVMAECLCADGYLTESESIAAAIVVPRNVSASPGELLERFAPAAGATGILAALSGAGGVATDPSFVAAHPWLLVAAFLLAACLAVAGAVGLVLGWRAFVPEEA